MYLEANEVQPIDMEHTLLQYKLRQFELLNCSGVDSRSEHFSSIPVNPSKTACAI